MKHSSNDSTLHTSLLQALQKNKVIQGRLTDCQRAHYLLLIKNMQTYHVEEKYNRELLYTWNKESYVRQLRKNLQEYEEQRFGKRDAYYQYQLQKLDDIIGGQQRLVVPHSEEERRSDVYAKYQRFLRRNPLQTSSIRGVKSANIPVGESDDEEDDEEEDEEVEINAHGVEETWKHTYAQSAVSPRRKQTTILPGIHRSATTNSIRRNKSSAKNSIPSKKRIATDVTVTKSSSNAMGLPDSIEPLILTSERLDEHSRADLVTMRSVRRSRKNPFELNLTFETRKRIYQINKRSLDLQLSQRKYSLQQNLQFNRRKPIETTNPPAHTTNEHIPKQDEDTKPSDQTVN